MRTATGFRKRDWEIGGDWAGRLPVSESPNLLHRFISQSIPTTHSHGATHGQKIYDLSQPLNQDCSFWPFYPPFEVKYFKRKSEHGVNAQYIQTSNHMGTHLDAPRHFVTNGKTIDQIPLDWLYGPGVIVDLSDLDELDVFHAGDDRGTGRRAGRRHPPHQHRLAQVQFPRSRR
ncbi:MAG: cyclase family protein [Caldilineaceae bacterium]